MSKYIDENGILVVVSSGISGGNAYMACRVRKSGSLQRIKSKNLPIRNTRNEAQEDLDLYAENRGWSVAEDSK